MLYWLFSEYDPVFRRLGLHSSGDSRIILTARIAVASILSFFLAIAFGPIAISWLKKRFPERIASASQRLNEIQSMKQSTPTMGGLFIVFAIVVASLLCADLKNPFVQLGLFGVIAFAVLGAVDDWIKVATRKNGLTVRQKLFWQVVISGVLAIGIYYVQFDQKMTPGVVWPIGNIVIPFGTSVCRLVGTCFCWDLQCCQPNRWT